MTVLHIFTEESSIEKVFEVLLPQILPDSVSFHIHPHQGKQDLERALQKTVPSISKIPNVKILITRDQDEDNCKELKQKLRNIVEDKCSCDFFIRIICKELESWFLGDLLAVEKAYPRFKAQQYSQKNNFKNVDNISKPSDFLRRIIPDYSDTKKLPKLETSQNIVQYMDINNNKSASFNHTINAIKKLIEE
jgi:tRNA U55 pseudouridine synthase TruB